MKTSVGFKKDMIYSIHVFQSFEHSHAYQLFW